MSKIKLGILAVYLSFFFGWCLVAGNPFYYLINEGPPGQWAYLLSKCVGFMAIAALLVQVTLGLYARFNIMNGSYRLHGYNALMLVVLVLLHPGLFVTGVSLRSGDIAWGVLIPKFNDYYHSMVGFGIAAALSITVAFIAKASKRHSSSATASMVHYLAASAGLLSVLHAFAIGSETRSVVFYLLISFVLAGGIVYGLVSARETKALKS